MLSLYQGDAPTLPPRKPEQLKLKDFKLKAALSADVGLAGHPERWADTNADAEVGHVAMSKVNLRGTPSARPTVVKHLVVANSPTCAFFSGDSAETQQLFVHDFS